MRVSLVGYVPHSPRLSRQVEEGLGKLKLFHGFNRNARQHSIVGGRPVKASQVTTLFCESVLQFRGPSFRAVTSFTVGDTGMEMLLSPAPQLLIFGPSRRIESPKDTTHCYWPPVFNGQGPIRERFTWFSKRDLAGFTKLAGQKGPVFPLLSKREKEPHGLLWEMLNLLSRPVVWSC